MPASQSAPSPPSSPCAGTEQTEPHENGPALERKTRLTGEDLPVRRTPIPGPASTALSGRLARVESRNVTCTEGEGPVFWTEARGANVQDADGNIFIDLTAGFGVAAAGHSNPRVISAICTQAGRLLHALGDVYPADIKVRLLERLARIAPGDLAVSILASAGSEAVEAALKTAMLRTGRPGVLAFHRAYHGLTYGALAATSRAEFREPFRTQLYGGVRFAPFPDESEDARPALDTIDRMLRDAEHGPAPVGAIIVEPIQGRGGLVVPADGFLRGLRDFCDGRSRILIFDEVYTGCGRTGRWFACSHWDVVPDVITVGKALGGGLPISAAIGSPAVMEAWPPSRGEALHTSTFLGHPVACAAALAQLEELETHHLLERATGIGKTIRSRAEDWQRRFDVVQGARGLGALQGLVLADGVALELARLALRAGVLVLAEGERLEVLAVTPPLVISDAQLEYALDTLENGLAALAA